VEGCVAHICRCCQVMDAKGFHGLSCKYCAGRLPRHAALNEVVMRALRSAGIPSVLEPVGVDIGDDKRPDGITVFPCSNGRSLCWDATCVDTYAQEYVNNSAVTPGEAVKSAEAAKTSQICNVGNSTQFRTYCIRDHGSLRNNNRHASFRDRPTYNAGHLRSERDSMVRAEIGIAVRRCNAFSILTGVKLRYDETRHSSELEGEPRHRQVVDGHHHERWPEP